MTAPSQAAGFWLAAQGVLARMLDSHRKTLVYAAACAVFALAGMAHAVDAGPSSAQAICAADGRSRNTGLVCGTRLLAGWGLVVTDAAYPDPDTLDNGFDAHDGQVRGIGAVAKCTACAGAINICRMPKFKGRTIFITGASSGIGAALARHFAAEGADLILTARRLDKLDEVARTLPTPHASVRTFKCDVTQDGEVDAVVEAVKRDGGRIDVVIANAGYGVAGKVQKLTIDDYRRQLEPNVFGILRTMYAALPELRRTRGQLVLMGSVAGYVPQPGMSAYGMSKFAVRALAETARMDLASDGIAVTLISPGFVDSDIRRVDNRGVLHAQAADPVPGWIRVPTDTAARQIVNAVYNRERERIITMHGYLAVFVYRHAPWLVRLVQRMGVKGRPEPVA